MLLDLLEPMFLLELNECVDEREGLQRGVLREGKTAENLVDLVMCVAKGQGVGDALAGDLSYGEGRVVIEDVGCAQVVVWRRRWLE